ncbi:His Kinase A (phospho-acceptor) domain-containing protein [Chitinophaga ginsengisegetis]|uniref:histidine kinase n=1 Tax=Chitinophaga ginsengisegetis TaxID=393003 RepID=A0A1T5N979_9BACT|nr:HAMP domain-containing sensor histidine kinase [Chitinophaga ginsengisegetis]SKC97020.1 His Kinase A (phospho-acceptor) domain-containing protein [Chitinophaga ginsengisegetis]
MKSYLEIIRLWIILPSIIVVCLLANWIYQTYRSEKTIFRSYATKILEQVYETMAKDATDLNVYTLQEQYRQRLEEECIFTPFQLYADTSIYRVKNDPRLLRIIPPVNNTGKISGVIFGKETGYGFDYTSFSIAISVVIMMHIIRWGRESWCNLNREKKLEQLKQNFITDITHELNTPLSVLHATNEALLTYKGMNNPEMTERYLKHNKKELDNLQELILRIINIVRLEEQERDIKIAPLFPEEILDNIKQRFSYKSQAIITIDILSPEPVIETDQHDFETILNHLLDNALKYNHHPVPEIRITVKANPTGIILTIADNGDGIHEKDLPFIFDKFYRVHQGDRHDVKGFGIGLSHVKLLIQKLNAQIHVQSTPGNGTQFTLQFPYYAKNKTTAG